MLVTCVLDCRTLRQWTNTRLFSQAFCIFVPCVFLPCFAFVFSPVLPISSAFDLLVAMTVSRLSLVLTSSMASHTTLALKRAFFFACLCCAVPFAEAFFWSTVENNFWDYRESNRQALYKVSSLFAMAPRSAIYFLQEDWPASARPAESPATWEWVVLPELYLWRNSDSILGGLPGFLPLLLLARVAVNGAKLFFSLFGVGSSPVKVVWEILVAEVGTLGLVLAYNSIVFPIIPDFLSDGLFWFSIYWLPIIQGVLFVLLPLLFLLCAAGLVAVCCCGDDRHSKSR